MPDSTESILTTITMPKLSLDEAPDFFGPQVLAKILGCGRDVGYALARSDGFPVIIVGNKRIIPKAAFIRWLKKNVG